MKKDLLLNLILFLTVLSAFSQNVGIGSLTPTAKLEIKSDASTSTTNALMVKNSNGDTLLRMKNNGNTNLGYNGPLTGRRLNIGGTGANFFKDDEFFGGAVFPTDSSLVIWSQSEDNNYVILQPTWGKVGIGTYGPKALLHVDGTMIIGAGGSVITKIIRDTILRDVGTLAAGGTTTQSFTITGAITGSTVCISPALALPDGILIAYARVSSSNTIEVKFCNITAGNLNPSSMNYYFTVIE
jgi:hypothetical protein